MDKISPLTWHARPKVQAYNYRYQPPRSAVQIYNKYDAYAHVPSRCHPHVNCQKFPPDPVYEDFSWIHSVPPVAKNLPSDHPLSPKRLREKEQAEAAAAAAERGEVIDQEKRSSAPSFSKENPNVSMFRTSSKKNVYSDLRKESSFGDLKKFTGHQMGGHYASKTGTILEVTRKDEIKVQQMRDIAEAKARILLAGGKLE